jgi:hypothetical protein
VINDKFVYLWITVVSRSNSWDMDFYLHVVSGVSTHLIWGNQMKSTMIAQAKRMRFIRVIIAHHKSEDTSFWKSFNSCLSDSYLDLKLILLLMDVILFYSRDRTPLCLSSSKITRHAQVGGDTSTRRGKPFNIDELLTFDRTSLRLRVSHMKNLIKAEGSH